MKPKKIIRLSGTIECVTGLAIKGMGIELGIGGADSEVIKNPLTNEPYIPGSSLKGKMRSQLEKVNGMKDRRGAVIQDKPCGCGLRTCKTCVVFGAHFNPGALSAPTRIIVRDSIYTETFKKQMESLPVERVNLEVKAENIIKRDRGTAEAPRFIERVPAGAEFTLEILLQIFEGDDEAALVAYVKEGLELVKHSALGGSGSRGYGQVKFHYNPDETVYPKPEEVNA